MPVFSPRSTIIERYGSLLHQNTDPVDNLTFAFTADKRTQSLEFSKPTPFRLPTPEIPYDEIRVTAREILNDEDLIHFAEKLRDVLRVPPEFIQLKITPPTS